MDALLPPLALVVLLFAGWSTGSNRQSSITCSRRTACCAPRLTAAGEGVLHGMQHVILDRDPMYTTAFRRLLRDCGVRPLVLPARSPNLNAFAERFVESIKCECLNRIVPLGEAHLRTAVQEFVRHYHTGRP